MVLKNEGKVPINILRLDASTVSWILRENLKSLKACAVGESFWEFYQKAELIVE